MIEITDKTKCCGCAACVNTCNAKGLSMVVDNEGFLYPYVDKFYCVNCSACEKVCPILNYKKNSSNSEQKAFIIQHHNLEICRQSTSGGAFTAIAEYTIANGGVVFGVVMQHDYTIKHVAVEVKEDLYKFRNSKYVQSRIGNSYQKVKENLTASRLVCFSGTPCQIEGLRHYLGKNYENLILVDIVCRAVPSPGVWKKYIAMEVKKHGQLKSIRFRDKTLGYQYSTMELRDETGNIYRGGIESQPWLRMFFSGMIIRPSCTDCQFRSQYRNSDFTIWDCFNVYSLDKNFDENIGTTKVLIHSKKGKKIFEQIKYSFKCTEITVDLAVGGVKEMLVSTVAHSKKNDFFREFNDVDMEELLQKYFPETFEVLLKKNTRRLLNHLGFDKIIKHIIKKINIKK